MIVAVVVEGVALVVLAVLVAGLLRSHAEILRALAAEPRERGGALPQPPASARAGAELRAAPLQGTTLAGDAVVLSFDAATSQPTLLAFLSSGCSTCAGFWERLAEPLLPAGVRTVIVTHDRARERPAKLRELAPPELPVLMSSSAWEDYRVPGSPYFVLVDGFIRGEGLATSWEALASLVGDAIADQREVAAGSRDVDAILRANGIGPDHPSLRPGERARA
jgi:hypothetical protein